MARTSLAGGKHKTRILIADDHGLVRAGLRSLLEKIPSVEVVAEASDGRETLDLIKTIDPDIVLMDIVMPRLSGVEAVGRISKEFPRTKAIVVSMHAGEEYVRPALRAGASGYLMKDAAAAELALAIQTVMHGKTYLSPPISELVIRNFFERPENSPRSPEQLTSRQREVLQMIAEGKNTKQIAATLEISAKTVEAHRLQMMARLGIHDVPGLVRYAIRNGIVAA
jgi:DNA-binding NarL/FixJ family response regulator